MSTLSKKYKAKCCFVITLVMFLFGVFTLSNTNLNIVQADTATNIAGGQPGYTFWRLYAMLLMDSKDTKDNAEQHVKIMKDSGIVHPVAKALGDGGITADLPYTYISAQGRAVARANDGDGVQGRMLASTLATYSHYGYLQTVSGNSIATQTAGWISGMGRFVGGILAGISIGLSFVAGLLLKAVANAIISINPMNLLGFSKTNVAHNPISDALKNFLNNIGFNPSLFKAIAAVTMLLATTYFCYKLMKALGNDGFKSHEIAPAAKNWFVRIFILFVFFPLCGSSFSYFVKEAQKYSQDSMAFQNPVESHIIASRAWAFTQNLAPNAVNSPNNQTVPLAYAKDHYIDKTFDPSNENVQKNIIVPINNQSYAAQGITNPNTRAFELLNDWISNDSFNVNTYAGDIRGGTASDDTDLPIYYGEPSKLQNVKTQTEKIGDKTVNLPSFSNNRRQLLRDLPSYIWSADQAPTESSSKPDGKSDKQNIPFDPESKLGVQNNSTFSTQTVALLLQSSFDDQGVHFYAYNIPPTGTKALAKNVSTVRTEWRTSSLLGAGMIGKFSSWLEMVVQSLTLSILILGVIYALLTQTIFDNFKLTFLRFFQTIFTANAGYAAGFIVLIIGTIMTVLMALTAPYLINPIISSISSTALGFMTNAGMGAYTQLINCVLTLTFVYFLVFKKGKDRESPLEQLVAFPMDIAASFDEKATRLLSGRTSLHLKPHRRKFSNAPRGASNSNSGFWYDDDQRDNERRKALKQALTNEKAQVEATDSSAAPNEVSEVSEGKNSGSLGLNSHQLMKKTSGTPNNIGSKQKTSKNKSVSMLKDGQKLSTRKMRNDQVSNGEAFNDQVPNNPDSVIASGTRNIDSNSLNGQDIRSVDRTITNMENDPNYKDAHKYQRPNLEDQSSPYKNIGSNRITQSQVQNPELNGNEANATNVKYQVPYNRPQNIEDDSYAKDNSNPSIEKRSSIDDNQPQNPTTPAEPSNLYRKQPINIEEDPDKVNVGEYRRPNINSTVQRSPEYPAYVKKLNHVNRENKQRLNNAKAGVHYVLDKDPNSHFYVDKTGHLINSGTGLLKRGQFLNDQQQIVNQNDQLIDPQTGLPLNNLGQRLDDSGNIMNQDKQPLPPKPEIKPLSQEEYNKQYSDSENLRYSDVKGYDDLGNAVMTNDEIYDLLDKTNNPDLFNKSIADDVHLGNYTFTQPKSINQLDQLDQELAAKRNNSKKPIPNFVRTVDGQKRVNYTAVQHAINAGKAANASPDQKQLSNKLQNIRQQGSKAVRAQMLDSQKVSRRSVNKKLISGSTKQFVSGISRKIPDNSILGSVNKSLHKTNGGIKKYTSHKQLKEEMQKTLAADNFKSKFQKIKNK